MTKDVKETKVKKEKKDTEVKTGKDTQVDENTKTDLKSKEAIEKALLDPTKKRKAEDEIEIDLGSSIPLSKKQKRLLRRGKITLEELNKKYNIDPASIAEFHEEQKSKSGKGNDNNIEETEDGEKKNVKTGEEKFGVWIGNLSFDTTSEELTKFIVAKTKDAEDSEDIVTEDDIIRIKLPLAKTDGKHKNKGFCYVDFKTEKHMKAVIGLSEAQLNGRNLLIKDSKSYKGRPDKDDLISMSKNPPSRILFVGNLSYNTTDELLRSHFQHCGEIIKIRMATFEDSGKCKGFAFIDFKNEEGATNALKDKTVRKIAMRPVRMEYGEDRSKRQVRRRPEQQKKSFDLPNENQNIAREHHSEPSSQIAKPPVHRDRPNRNPRYNANMASNNRLKSSVALASAQRGSAAIVPSKGKKTTFD